MNKTIGARYALAGTLSVLGICSILLLSWVAPRDSLAQATSTVSITGLHVVGNQLVNGAGQPVRLLGVNRSGTEYACIQGWGIFDGPSDAASIQAIASWHTNAVRVPLNQDCWLAVKGAPAAYSGAAYQTAIANYVTALNTAGFVVILELHWSAPASQQATGMNPMPDRDYSITFWQQVANAYKNNSSVIFDLFNEPFPDNNQDSPAAWRCWRDGGTCPGLSYQAAGMQELVNAVRGTGATNVILLGGLQHSNALSQWLTYKPTDPTGNLAASWHVYNFNPCNTPSCWTANAGPVAQQVPLIVTEIGEDDGGHSFIDALMSWLDAREQSYLAWTWNTWGCGGPVLISNYNGTPCQTFGQGFKDHLALLATGASPTAAAPAPGFTVGGTVTPSSAAPGATVDIVVSVTSATTVSALVDVEVYDPSGNKALQKVFDNESFTANERRTYPVSWTVPSDAVAGTYAVRAGVFGPGWGQLYTWDNDVAQFSTTSTTLSAPRVCPCSLWSSSTTPVAQAYNEPNGIELGVKFRSSVDGYITGLRFYKGAGASGTHVGNLWTSAGTLLATATFTGETASGWQQVSFPAAVAISANTTYVASYYVPAGGGYMATGGAFSTTGVENSPLHAVANSADPNGVFTYGSTSAFPTQTFNATNYWVDVIFTTP